MREIILDRVTPLERVRARVGRGKGVPSMGSRQRAAPTAERARSRLATTPRRRGRNGEGGNGSGIFSVNVSLARSGESTGEPSAGERERRTGVVWRVLWSARVRAGESSRLTARTARSRDSEGVRVISRHERVGEHRERWSQDLGGGGRRSETDATERGGDERRLER